MGRQPRLEFPGAIYHVLNRGDRKKPIFLDDVDRQDFLKTLAETCQKTGFQIHAYCLMKNHFHLVIETPQANLVAGMRRFLGAYTIRLNARHKLTGHVFAGRYKSLLVEGSGNGYLRTVCDYVHLNPFRAKQLGPTSRLLEYPWSSFGYYLAAAQHRPAWLRTDRLMGEHGLSRDTAVTRQQFEQQMQRRAADEARTGDRGLGRGWCLGSAEFKSKMLERLQSHLRPGHVGEAPKELERAKAQAIIAAELKRSGWTEKKLSQTPKGQKEKVRWAMRLRRETTLTVAEIGELLKMGSRHYVNFLLHKHRKEP